MFQNSQCWGFSMTILFHWLGCEASLSWCSLCLCSPSGSGTLQDTPKSANILNMIVHNLKMLKPFHHYNVLLHFYSIVQYTLEYDFMPFLNMCNLLDNHFCHLVAKFLYHDQAPAAKRSRSMNKWMHKLHQIHSCVTCHLNEFRKRLSLSLSLWNAHIHTKNLDLHLNTECMTKMKRRSVSPKVSLMFL